MAKKPQRTPQISFSPGKRYKQRLQPNQQLYPLGFAKTPQIIHTN